MMSVGNVAYDAFRTQVGWLPEWHTLSSEMQAKWDALAQSTMSAADTSSGGEVKP